LQIFDIVSPYISVTVQDSPIIAADDYQKSYRNGNIANDVERLITTPISHFSKLWGVVHTSNCHGQNCKIFRLGIDTI